MRLAGGVRGRVSGGLVACSVGFSELETDPKRLGSIGSNGRLAFKIHLEDRLYESEKAKGPFGRA